jgi:hypothetical protein
MAGGHSRNGSSDSYIIPDQDDAGSIITVCHHAIMLSETAC